MERDAFFAKVRAAAASGRQYQVALNPQATAAESYVGGGADPVATFLQEWQLVGGQGARVSSRSAILAYLEQVLSRHPIRTVMCWKHDVLDRWEIIPWLRERGLLVEMWDELEQLPAAERLARSFAADLGITSVSHAIAETGSLVMCSQAGGQGRSVSLLPKVHLALLEPDQIVPDLFDLFQIVSPERGELPSNLVLITGPSKTGDIQLQLTTGVHGPGEVHAVVIEPTA